VKTVDTAYSRFHTDLMRIKDNKSSDAKDIVENADKLLKSLRQNAVKAIHATKTCAGAKDDDDEDDQDEDEDHERGSSKREGNFIVVLFSNLQSLFGTHTVTVNTTTASASPGASTSPNPSASPSATNGASRDPMTIAENAVAAMQLVFDEAKAQLDDLPTPSPRAVNTPKPKGTAKADDHRGKNEHGPHNDSDGDEDEDDD
jgi:hypothetical protein